MTSTVHHGKSSAADDEQRTGDHARRGWMRSSGYCGRWLLVLFVAVLSVTLAVVWNSVRNIYAGSEFITIDPGASALESAKGFELHAALSPLGTILCVDSGEVVQYARVGTELRNGDNVVRETTDSCEELTEEIQAIARQRLYANKEDEWVETMRAHSAPKDTGDTEGLIVDASPLSDSAGYEVYVGLSSQGTVLCSDNGVVEPYAIVEGKLRGAEDQAREWTPECALVVKGPKTATTIKEDGKVYIETIAPGELEVFDSLEELIARSRAVPREQGSQSLG